MVESGLCWEVHQLEVLVSMSRGGGRVPRPYKAVLIVTSPPLSIPLTSGDTIYVITYLDDYFKYL